MSLSLSTAFISSLRKPPLRKLHYYLFIGKVFVGPFGQGASTRPLDNNVLTTGPHRIRTLDKQQMKLPIWLDHINLQIHARHFQSGTKSTNINVGKNLVWQTYTNDSMDGRGVFSSFRGKSKFVQILYRQMYFRWYAYRAISCAIAN